MKGRVQAAPASRQDARFAFPTTFRLRPNLSTAKSPERMSMERSLNASTCLRWMVRADIEAALRLKAIVAADINAKKRNAPRSAEPDCSRLAREGTPFLFEHAARDLNKKPTTHPLCFFMAMGGNPAHRLACSQREADPGRIGYSPLSVAPPIESEWCTPVFHQARNPTKPLRWPRCS